MRVVFDSIRTAGVSKGTCLRLGKTRAVAAGWFSTVHDVMLDHPPNEDIFDLNHADGTLDVIVCIDALERAVEPMNVLRRLMQFVRPGGYLFLALQHVPGRKHGMDWGFPRGDRQGEYRMFGEDFESSLAGDRPSEMIVAADPVDPVTEIATRAYLLAHTAGDLRKLLASQVTCRVICGAEADGVDTRRLGSEAINDVHDDDAVSTLDEAIAEIDALLRAPIPTDIATRLATTARAWTSLDCTAPLYDGTAEC